MASPGTQAFLKMLEGQSSQSAPVRYSNVHPSYRTPAFPSQPSGVVPAGARVSPQPPQSEMTQYQQGLTPMGKRILQGLAAKREDQADAAPTTPGAGQVDLAGQPKGTDSFMSRLMTPQSQGMLGAAAAGFEASGYQDRPVSLGQVLGRMGTAGMKAYTAAEDRIAAQKAAQAPKIQVAGKDIYRVYPDGRVERLNGGAGADTSVEIKSEAGRYMTEDGRIIQAVLGKDGSLYEAGAASTDKKLDPSKLTIVDPYTTLDYKGLQKHKKDEILAPERTLKIIDRFATQIEAGSQGYFDRLKTSMSAKIKNFSNSSDYSEQEIINALQEGTLTQLVGAARLELFGPGVMTEFEQQMARQVLAGDFDNLRKEIALPRLKQFRDAFYDQYVNSVNFYNNQPIVKSQKMSLTPYSGFDWNKLDGTSGSGAPAASGNTTTGGNTWSVIR